MMRILSFILTALLTFFLIQGCSSSTETKAKADGTITVKLTGAAAEANGKTAFISIWPAGTNLSTIPAEEYEEKVEAANFCVIANGSGEASMLDMSTYMVKKFKGGTKHDIQLLVDLNGNIDIMEGFDPSDPSIFEGAIMTDYESPPSVTIDGNMTVTINYEDLKPVQ